MRCIFNKEDVTYTEDIEQSIDELGFIDPIEVMPIDRGTVESGKFKCLEGASINHRHLILSGHRRFEAAIKKGITEIPCMQFNKKFEGDAEIENYVLMANCHRDSSKDPLLLYRRYIAHRDYFAINCPGMKASDIDRAIAPRMGLSAGHIRRFRSLDTIIEPLFDMVRKGEIALSGVERMAVLTSEQQREIYGIFRSMLAECEDNGEEREISRSEANRIIKAYKSVNVSPAENMTLPAAGSESDNLQKVTELHTVCKNDDEHIAPGQAAQEYVPDDGGDNCGYNNDVYSNTDNHNTVIGSPDHGQVKEHGSHKSLLWLLDKLADTRGTHGCDWSDIQSEDEAADKARAIANAVVDLIDEIYSIAETHRIGDMKDEVLADIVKAANRRGLSP